MLYYHRCLPVLLGLLFLMTPILPLALAAESSNGTLDLDEAILEGRAHSPELQKAQAAAEEAGWKRNEALAGFLPTLNVSGAHYLEEKYLLLNIDFQGNPVVFPQIFPTTVAQINANLPIFDGFQNVYSYRAAGNMKTAAEQNSDWTDFRVTQSIRLNYLKALAAQLLEEVAKENLKTISDHLNQTESLRKGGVATNYDVLRVQVQLNEAKSGVMQASDNVELSRRQLSVVMGSEADQRKLKGDLPVPNSRAVENVEVQSSQRADLAALTNLAEAADKRHSASATWLVPRVSLMGNFTEYNDLDNSWVNSNNFRSAYSLGVAVSWNLFDGGVSLARQKEAAYQQIQSEKALEQAKLQAPYDFDFWKKRYLYSAARYISRKSDVEASEESVRLAREGLKAGTRTSTEVLDAELDLFRARAGVVNAQMDCAEAQVNLELAVGYPLRPIKN